MTRLIQKGNTKLHNCYMFNIPASKEICGQICPNCYARKEQIRFPIVKNSRTVRYIASLEDNFANKVIDELNHLRNLPKYFRIHASGEFYSPAYINKWVTIAKKFEHIIFYAYTKRLNDFDFSILQALPNVVLINSLQYGGLNYGKLEDAPQKSFVCPYGIKPNVKCGDTCTYCMTKGKADITGVYFLRH